MMFLKCIYVVLVVISVQFVISQSSTVNFKISKNNGHILCNSSEGVTVPIGSDLKVNLFFQGTLNNYVCLRNEDNSEIHQKFKEKRRHVYSSEIKNATTKLNGTMECFLDLKLIDSNKQESIKCSILVHVVPKPEESSGLNIDKTTLYYIGGGVAGFIILLIIIIQAIYLKRYKNMIRKKPGVADLKPNRSNVDEGRYSSMPPDKKLSLKNNRESQIYHSVESLDTTASRSPVMKRPPMPLPDDEHIYDDGETLTRMFAPQPPAINTLPKHYPNKSTPKGPVVATKPKPTPKPQPKLHVPEDYDYPDTQVLIKTISSSRTPKKNSQPLPPKVEKTKVKPPVPGPSKCPGKPPGLGNVPIVNELENHFKKIKKNELPAPAPKPMKTPVTPGFPRGSQPSKFTPTGTQSPKSHPQRFQLPEVQPQGFKNIDRGPQFSPGPRDLRPQEGQRSFHQQAFNPPLPATPRSPPLPKVQKPLPLAPPIAQSPPLPLRPSNLRNVQPYEEETYSEVAENSDEEWTYEPLKEYNFYNV